MCINRKTRVGTTGIVRRVSFGQTIGEAIADRLGRRDSPSSADDFQLTPEERQKFALEDAGLAGVDLTLSPEELRERGILTGKYKVMLGADGVGYENTQAAVGGEGRMVPIGVDDPREGVVLIAHDGEASHKRTFDLTWYALENGGPPVTFISEGGSDQRYLLEWGRIEGLGLTAAFGSAPQMRADHIAQAHAARDATRAAEQAEMARSLREEQARFREVVRSVDPAEIYIARPLSQWAQEHPRVMGGLQAAGGALEVVGGIATTGAGLATSEVGIGIPVAAGGILLIGHGGDDIQAGLRTAFSGTPTPTFTNQGIQALGASPEQAAWIEFFGTASVGSVASRSNSILRASGRSGLLAGDFAEATWFDPNGGLGAQGFARIRGARAVASVGTEGYDLELFFKPGWSAAQRLEAQTKVNSLTNGDTVVTRTARRGSSSASRRYQREGNIIPAQSDVDHVIDLQLGGADTVYNMWPLNSSVNRSLGPQIRWAIKDLPAGTRVNTVTIRNRP